MTEPLRRLTKHLAQWEWTIAHQQSFDKLKNELVADRVMSYFDPNKETMLIVDANLSSRINSIANTRRKNNRLF